VSCDHDWECTYRDGPTDTNDWKCRRCGSVRQTRGDNRPFLEGDAVTHDWQLTYRDGPTDANDWRCRKCGDVWSTSGPPELRAPLRSGCRG